MPPAAVTALSNAVSSSMPPNITLRDVSVNTIRVRRPPRLVNNERMAFADRLKFCRQQTGMTQEQLALRCGWSGQSRVANYESSGKSVREPPLDELPILADALGVPVGVLVDDREFAVWQKRQGMAIGAGASKTGKAKTRRRA